ncbi:MAG: UvrD-helicase domain-containing protein [Legionella sp.]
MTNDNAQRLEATNPRESFIVQAPAGSGKTEILIQRYLRLLATVSTPEQIIALTFTRKAANEMRERVLAALQQTRQGYQAKSDHQRQTFIYARAALERDKYLNWQLLNNTSRLRIFTIDSLCQQITQAIPLQDQQIPFAQITDTPQRYYTLAARACLDHALNDKHYQPALITLLKHLDNRQDKLFDLLCNALAQRDQWLSPLHQARLQQKEWFEQALINVERLELKRLQNSVPEECQDELTSLCRQLALIENDPLSRRYPLQKWYEFKKIDRNIASSLAGLLLTSQDSLRKSFDHHVGLKRGLCPNDIYNHLKTSSKELLEKLNDNLDFINALVQIKALPDPVYNPKQWQVLQALFTLLPLLSAHLQLVFTATNQIDFNGVAQQAIAALGDEDNPTDLALYIDNQIHHLLIDEFQDTSLQQFQLISKLIQGWQSGDGRTLFVVGDPMQSIYRFRAAEVGLFLLAQQQGIGAVKPKSLTLSCNFRSHPTLVSWVNHHFKSIFPSIDDISSGAVSFHSSEAKARCEHSELISYHFETSEHEALAVVELVSQQLKSYPDETIAILVRSRRQLIRIIHHLRIRNIAFQGVDIDLLSNQPHVRDIWTITQALLMPADRISWLALLRSPWCGLSLTDIHCIANIAKKKSIYYTLSQLTPLSGLSEEGLVRSQFIYHVLDHALHTRQQQPLVEWILQTLKKLHIDYILDDNQQDELEQFWILLETFEQQGQLTEISLFKRELTKIYSKKAQPSRLQIMTIHKSKGLEFDAVILPGLSSKTNVAHQPLLRWLELPNQEQNLLLISPLKATDEEHCSLYDYISKLDNQKNSYEQQRLLYVAVTRAKKRLYLFDNQTKVMKGTFRDLLHKQSFIPFDGIQPAIMAEEQIILPRLTHLPLHFYQYQQDSIPSISANHPPLFNNSNARLLGIVAHELLQWICTYHPRSMTEIPWQLAIKRLQALGFAEDAIDIAKTKLAKQIEQLLQSNIGQWLTKAHEQEQNEYALVFIEHGQLVTRIIDRTFCEHGIRWIIDFKSGEPQGLVHREQVNNYAELFAKQHPHPIRCGLYYLNDGEWQTWVYQP